MRTKNKDVKNELVEELSKKLEQIKDPIDFINNVDALDSYISKAGGSPKYEAARKKVIVCNSCEKMFLKKGAKTTTDVTTENICIYSSPWGDDREYEDRTYKNSYYICPHCNYKNIYAKEITDPVSEAR